MNQRNAMLEEMTKRNNPIEALPYALQYYTDLISEAVFPINEADAPVAVAALEIISDAIREKNKETGKMADTIKAIIEYEKQEIQGETKTLEEIHRKLYGEKR